MSQTKSKSKCGEVSLVVWQFESQLWLKRSHPECRCLYTLIKMTILFVFQYLQQISGQPCGWMCSNVSMSSSSVGSYWELSCCSSVHGWPTSRACSWSTQPAAPKEGPMLGLVRLKNNLCTFFIVTNVIKKILFAVTRVFFRPLTSVIPHVPHTDFIHFSAAFHAYGKPGKTLVEMRWVSVLIHCAH